MPLKKIPEGLFQDAVMEEGEMDRICFSALLLWLLPLLVSGCSMDEFRRSAAVGQVEAEGSQLLVSDGLADLSKEPVLNQSGEDRDRVSGDELMDSLDRETLEDLALLKAADQAVPEDQGETVSEEDSRFDLPMVDNAKVRHYIAYYSGPGRFGFRRWLQRSERYLPLMRDIFAEEGLPLDLTYLAMIESGFNPRAVSHAGAVGPWQFMEATGRVYGLNNDWWKDERRDFVKSTRAAATYLRELHQRFDGDWYLAAAAYNAGGGRVNRAIRAAGSRDFWEISRGGHLPAETRNYLPKLLAVLHIAKDPQDYGFDDLQYKEPLHFDVFRLPGTTDLALIAELCGVSYEDLVALNPELKRWSTPPGAADYEVRLPAGKTEAFARRYAAVPPERRANFLHHRIVSGDTLIGIANRYGIRTQDIVALNRIQNPRALRVGRDLVLPLRSGVTLPVAALGDDYDRPRQQNYRVKNGDSLWVIARRFDLTVKQLCALNGLNEKDILRPGRVLRVAGPVVASDSDRRQLVYQVRPGDTLWAIGRRYNVRTDDIMRWNRLSRNAILRPGDRLTLLVKPGRQG